MLEPLVTVAGQGFRRAGLVDFSPEQMRYLQHGRVADVSRLAKRFGWAPRPTVEAFDDFAKDRIGLLSPPMIAAAEEQVLDRLSRRRTVSGAVGA